MSGLTEQRIETIREYFRRVDARDGGIEALFTDDVQLHFPKFGVAQGKAAMRDFAARISAEAAELNHDIAGLIFTADGNRIAVEGREWGVTADGRSWPDGEISQGRFANVFEFEGALISRVHIYVDPDFTSDDVRRVQLYRGGEGVASAREIARRYLDAVAAFWAEPAATASLDALSRLFAEDAVWEIPGDIATVPWIGSRHGRTHIRSFFHELQAHIRPHAFTAHKIVADESTAVILGELASEVKATGKLIRSPFAIELTVRNGLIISYQLLEDSFAVRQAAH